MKWIGSSKGLARGVERKLLRHLLAMVLYPVPEFITGGERIPVEQNPAIARNRVFVPLEEAAPDDFGGFRFRRHHHRLANPVEKLFEALVVGLVVGAHFKLRGRNRHGEHHVVAPPCFLAQIVKKAVKLGGHATLAATADKIHQLVHQDQYRLFFRQERTDYVAAGCNSLPLMFRENCKGFFTANLESNFAPGGLPRRGSVGTATPGNGIEFSTDKYRDLGRGYRVDSGDLEQPGDALPALRLRAVIGEVIQQGKGVGLAAAELRRHVKHGGRFGLLPGQPAKNLGGHAGEPFGQKSTLQKALRVLIDRRGTSVPDLIKVNGELRRIEGLPFSEVLPRRNDFIPGFECHAVTFPRGSFPLLEPELLFAGEHTIHPAFFI